MQMLELFTKLLFLYLPFQFALNPLSGVDLASARVFILLLFFYWFTQSLLQKKITLRLDLIFLLLFSFLFFTVLSLFWAENKSWGIRKIIFFFSILPIFFIIRYIFASSLEKTRQLLNFTLWGAFLASLLGIIQFLLQFLIPLNKLYSFWAILITPFLGQSFSQAVLSNPSWLVNVGGHTLLRATAFFPDPHMLAFYLNICATIFLGMFLNVTKNKTSYNNPAPSWNLGRHLHLIFFLTLTLASFLTFSRGGYLGLLSGLVFFIILTFKSKFKKLLNNLRNIAILISIFLFFIAFFIIPNPVSNRLLSSFNLTEGSNIGRLDTWHQSFEIIKQNPLLGVGIGNYSLAIKPSADYREPIYSHNTFLDIAAETGIINLFLWVSVFLIAIFSFTRDFIRRKNYLSLSLAASLFGFSVHSLFETAIFSVHVLPLIILILALNKEKNETSSL